LNEKSGTWFWLSFPKIPNEKAYGFLNISPSLMKNAFLITKRNMLLTAKWMRRVARELDGTGWNRTVDW
jgi:hypothetical protein